MCWSRQDFIVVHRSVLWLLLDLENCVAALVHVAVDSNMFQCVLNRDVAGHQVLRRYVVCGLVWFSFGLVRCGVIVCSYLSQM